MGRLALGGASHHVPARRVPGAGGGGPTPPPGGRPRAGPGSERRRRRPAGDLAAVTARALDAAGVTVVRVPPAVDVLPLVEAALARGQALVLAPGRPEAAELAGRLRRDGFAVARPPEGWARGSRRRRRRRLPGRALVPGPRLGAVVVLDEHDPRYQEERAPTWHARDVAVERARRAGVPCLLVSPTPSPESLALGPQLAPSRA